MTVPTLPGTNWPAPIGFFLFLGIGGEALAFTLVIFVFLGAIISLVIKHVITAVESESTEADEPPSSCMKALDCLSSAFIIGMRKLIVKMFPGLFKEHKDRYQDQSKNLWVTRKFMLFLDRRVESNHRIVVGFYTLATFIIFSAVLVFFRHVPIAITGNSECLERDDMGRTLFCYTNGTILPVDCDLYNATELEDTTFQCYAITILSVGIALAAAGSLAKLATVCITIYIRVSETIYMWSHGNEEKYCKLRASSFYAIYLLATCLLLYFFAIASYAMVLLVGLPLSAADDDMQSYIVFIAYGILPFLLVPTLPIIMRALGKHCNQEEYISYCERQMPECEDDRDVHMKPARLRNKVRDPEATYRHTSTSVTDAPTSTATDQAGGPPTSET